MPNRKSVVEQLRGATRLAVEATRSVTDIVQAMHHTIGGGPDVLGRPLERITQVVTAPTYGAIQGVTRLVGAGIDLALAQLQPLVDQAGSEQAVVLAALNGVIGDYLAETGNPLAIPMRLCGTVAPHAGRVVVLVHGSSMNDTQWLRKGHHHGEALAKELGVGALALRYNSGLHISQNGRAFAALLETLDDCEELILIGHSMGGLVSRAACHVGELEHHRWRRKLRALITLGTPHHGAPLERGGNWIDLLLEVSRYSAPLARLGHLRSAGVTDLRYGNVRDEDWQGKDRFAKEEDPRQVLPLPSGVACFAIAATTTTGPSQTLASDGLVPVDSALGRHADPARSLAFPEAHQRIVRGCGHLDLLSSQEVYGALRTWLAAASR